MRSFWFVTCILFTISPKLGNAWLQWWLRQMKKEWEYA